MPLTLVQAANPGLDTLSTPMIPRLILISTHQSMSRASLAISIRLPTTRGRNYSLDGTIGILLHTPLTGSRGLTKAFEGFSELN